MEPAVIYSFVVGLLIGGAGAVVAYAVGRLHGKRDACQEDPTRSSYVDIGDPRIARLAREREFAETRRVPRFRAHGGAAMALLLAASCAWPEPALAQEPPGCITDAALKATLDHYQEVKVGNALSGGSSPGIYQLWIGQDSMTIVLALPGGRNCIMAAGGKWSWIHPEGPAEVRIGASR